MTVVVTFPDAEETAINLLKEQLGDIPVSTVVPQAHTVTDARIRVSRTGGVISNKVTDGALILVECYSDTTAAASRLAAKARTVMLNAPGLTGVVRHVIEAGGLSYLPDPVTGQPKYQFLVQLDMRGETTMMGI